MERTHYGQHDEDCFGCKLQSIQWSSKGMPWRNNIPPRPLMNNWEKGIAKDSRGMPLLDSGGNQIGLQELADNRSRIESDLRRLKNTPPAPAPKE
jgi:hypothetical protein